MHGSMRTVDTPIGRYTLVATADGLAFVGTGDAGGGPDDPSAAAAATRHAEAAARALAEYFAGRRVGFDDIALAPSGTAFQQRVWRALRAIPFGSTRSYGEIARRIGHPGAARAIGAANHHNPLAIVTPCHRVVGADGSLVGYAGGIERKRWLLAHEGARVETAARSVAEGGGSETLALPL